MRSVFWMLLLVFSISANAQMEIDGEILFGNEWIDYDKQYLKISVKEDGIYRISRAELISFQIPLDQISLSNLVLYNYGKSVPFFVSPDAQYIEFYGTKNRSELDEFIYPNKESILNPEYSVVSDESAYFLTWTNEVNPLLVTPVNTDLSTNTLSPETYYLHKEKVILSQKHYKPVRDGEQVRFSNFIASEGFGSRIHTSNSIEIPLADAVNNGVAGSAMIRFGGNYTQFHKTIISMNGEEVETHNHSLSEVVQREYPITYSDFSGPSLRFSITGIASEADKNIISMGEVTYPRMPKMSEDTTLILHYSASANSRYIELDGYAFSDVPIIYDLEANRRITPEITDDGKVAFILPPVSNEKKLFLTSSTRGIKVPEKIVLREFVDYNEPSANFIIISNALLRNQGGTDWVQEYADYRASITGGSFNPLIANVDQLYDQFAYGIDRHFIAFRNFGFWTKENFTDPQFMFIIGKGREYRANRTEEQIAENLDAFVPTWGNPASDNLILSNDEIPLPIYPIGRLAAKNATEIKEYLEKVKEHDENMKLPQTVEDRLWQKRVLHLSGGDQTLQEVLARNLDVMEDTLTNNKFGAEVTTFYKRSIEAIEVTTSERIFDLINSGVSIITFFGHSSVGQFDFNIDNIDKYSNKGKYPLVFSLGCYSGNIHTNEEGISEQFVIRKDRGAVSFIAASGTAYVNQQFLYGLRYYERLGGEDYGKAIGTILTNVIEEYSDNTNYSFITFLQQLTLHGDPAIRLASFETPDLLPDASTVKTNPTFVDTYEDDFELCFEVANIGKAQSAEYDVLIEHFGPEGELVTDTVLRSAVPTFKQEYCVRMPIPSNRLVGKNTIKVTVDAGDEIDERPMPDGELNNRLISNSGNEGFEFYILNNSAIPIYPKEFAIVNEADVALVAATYNALGGDQRFVIQIDTTEKFNSPLLRETELFNVKALAEWELDFALLPKTVYYWRISPDASTTGVGNVWSESSFVYDPEARNGWNQSHYFQYLKDDFENMFINNKREFSFAKNLTEIKINNRVRVSGSPPNFSINNDSWREAMDWNKGPFLAVTVIDTLGRFLKAPVGGVYGSINPYQVPIITHNFRVDRESRIQMVNFIKDVVPESFYVCFYPIFRSASSNFNIEEWALDSLDNSGRNIFNVLEEEGSLSVREMHEKNQVLPYAFVYQKGVSPLAEALADSIDQEIIITEEVPSFWFEGSFTTDFIGPATMWDELEWSIRESSVMAFDTSICRVYGYDRLKSNRTLLFDKVEAKSLDLSSVDAQTYPYLKVEYYANDFIEVSPVQVEFLRVYYEGFPDIAFNTTKNYNFYADSLQQGEQLTLVYDVTNFSENDMASSKVEYRIIDSNNNVIKEIKDIPAIKSRESKTINFDYDTRQLLGEYQFQVELNETRSPEEVYYFNNFGLKDFKVSPDKINPLLNVTFDGIVIMDQDIVSSNPLITIELLDENPYILLENPENFTVLLQSPSGDISQVTIDDPALDFYPAQDGDKNKARIEYNPELLEDGEYTLTVEARDESNNSSGDKNYEVRFRVFNEEMVSNVFNYPNPFSTSTQFIFTLTGNEEPGNVLIRIMTLSGKVVREITSAELGPLRIGLNRTEFKWDGRDEFGSKLGNGTYLYQVITKKLDGSDYKHFSDPRQNNTDYMFKEGFGKLVIMR